MRRPHPSNRRHHQRLSAISIRPDPSIHDKTSSTRGADTDVMTHEEIVVGAARFATDEEGHAAMLPYVTAWPQRTWAIEGCQGTGGRWRWWAPG